MNKVILVIASIVFVFFSCKQKQPPPNPPVPVNLYTVSATRVLYYDEYPATTVALSQVNLQPQVLGYITGIFFTEGTFVKKGQELYEIDQSLYQQNYNAAVANLKIAQGNRDLAKQDADRYTYLNDHNAIAKQILDHAVIALHNADDSVKGAEDALKNAKTNLTFSKIFAPFDGLIGFSQVKLGNLVTVGTTVLNTISTVDPMAVDFLINEKQLAHYQDLEKNKQGKVDSLFTIILPNNTIYPYVGKISVIDRAVDPQTGTIRIRLVFPNPQYNLKAGMSCVVRVHNQETTPQMVIPNRAVVEQMGEYFVFIAKDTTLVNSADSSAKKSSETVNDAPRLRAFQIKVQLGQTIGANVIIRSGINDGDKIVVDGLQAIHEGSQINASKPPTGKNETGSNQNKDSSKNN